MKTTIDIPETELERLLEYTHARTKKEAVLMAIREYTGRMRRRELADTLGSFEEFMSGDVLVRERGARGV